MTQQKDAGKDQRVVLNLSLEQAEALHAYFMEHGGNVAMLPLKNRIEKSITKHKLLARFQEQGIEPTKEAIKAGLSEALK
jgi:hypothetical protein